MVLIIYKLEMDVNVVLHNAANAFFKNRQIKFCAVIIINNII